MFQVTFVTIMRLRPNTLSFHCLTDLRAHLWRLIPALIALLLHHLVFV